MEEKEKYVAINISFSLTKDDYFDGESLESSSWDTTQTFEGDTINSVVDKVARFYGFDTKNSIVFGNEIMMNMLSDENGDELNADEIKRWKKREIDGYSYDIRFRIVKMVTIPHDELVACGYDDGD